MDKIPKICIILGSESDRPVLEQSGALEILQRLKVSHSVSIASCHRNPEELAEFCKQIFYDDEGEGGQTEIFIVAAGKTAALPGHVAAILKNRAIVYGVPLPSEPFGVIDSTLAIVSLPRGTLVRMMGVGKDGLYNCALEAAKHVAMSEGRTLEWWELKDDEGKKKPPKFNTETWFPKEE